MQDRRRVVEHLAKTVAEELIAKGFATHPWLGFVGSTLDPETAESFDLPVQEGAIIRRVIQDSPADVAGLQEGDIIAALDGTPVASMDEVMLEIRKREVGDTITVTYFRGEEEIETTAVLEEKPSELPQ